MIYIYTYNEDNIYIYMYTYNYIYICTVAYNGYSVVNGGTVRGTGIHIPNKIGGAKELLKVFHSLPWSQLIEWWIKIWNRHNMGVSETVPLNPLNNIKQPFTSIYYHFNNHLFVLYFQIRNHPELRGWISVRKSLGWLYLCLLAPQVSRACAQIPTGFPKEIIGINGSVEGKVLTGNHGFRTGKYRGFLQKFPLNLFWDGKESAHTLPVVSLQIVWLKHAAKPLHGGMCLKLFHKRSLYLCTSTNILTVLNTQNKIKNLN